MQFQQLILVEAILLQHSIWSIIFMLLRDEYIDTVEKKHLLSFIKQFLNDVAYFMISA